MSSDLVTVTSETTIREAMELLAARHVSGAPVISGRTLVGVVSANDLMAFAGALPGVPTERETQSDWVETLEPPVTTESRAEDGPAGAYFSDLWEDAGADLAARFASVSTPEWNFLEEHDVSEVMTRMPVHTLSADDSAEAAASMMRDARIHRILITGGDELVGIVTSFDITRAVAENRFESDS